MFSRPLCFAADRLQFYSAPLGPYQKLPQKPQKKNSTGIRFGKSPFPVEAPSLGRAGGAFTRPESISVENYHGKSPRGRVDRPFHAPSRSTMNPAVIALQPMARLSTRPFRCRSLNATFRQSTASKARRAAMTGTLGIRGGEFSTGRVGQTRCQKWIPKILARQCGQPRQILTRSHLPVPHLVVSLFALLLYVFVGFSVVYWFVLVMCVLVGVLVSRTFLSIPLSFF